jgi:hypothetical protein
LGFGRASSRLGWCDAAPVLQGRDQAVYARWPARSDGVRLLAGLYSQNTRTCAYAYVYARTRFCISRGLIKYKIMSFGSRKVPGGVFASHWKAVAWNMAFGGGVTATVVAVTSTVVVIQLSGGGAQVP